MKPKKFTLVINNLTLKQLRAISLFLQMLKEDQDRKPKSMEK